MISLMKTRVHVLRHGEVENPNKVLYGRQPNWHLSNRGVQMAEAVADWSKDRPIRAIHVSPLERAQETAAPIVAAHGISITTDPRLIEAANVFEGKPFQLEMEFYVVHQHGVTYGIHGVRLGANHIKNRLKE